MEYEIFLNADANKNEILERDEFVHFRDPEYSAFVKKAFAEKFIAEHDRNGDQVSSGSFHSSRVLRPL